MTRDVFPDARHRFCVVENYTPIDHGHTTGTAIVRDGASWHCWTWQETGAKWMALAFAEADSEQAARDLVAERLAEEVERHLAPA